MQSLPPDTIRDISKFLPKEMKCIVRTVCKTFACSIPQQSGKITKNTILCWAEQQGYTDLCTTLIKDWGAEENSVELLQGSIEKLSRLANHKFFYSGDNGHPKLCVNKTSLGYEELEENGWFKTIFNVDCEIIDSYQMTTIPDIDKLEVELEIIAETQQFEYDGDIEFKFRENVWKMFRPTYKEILNEIVKYMNCNDCDFPHQTFKFKNGRIELSLEYVYLDD